MKTEIENLFDLSSCEHDSYSSSAVCHSARVLYKNAWISIDWQITFWGDRLWQEGVLANGILRRAFDAGASSPIRVFPSRGL